MTNYPGALDSLSNPISTDTLASVDHAAQHANANDAIEALQAKVGANSSAVTTSHDYKLSGVTGADKAVSKTGTETLTNKTLTAPQINMGSDATGDMYYRTGAGAFARLPIGSTGQILDVSAGGIPEWISNPAAADASSIVKGVVEIATQAETDAGTGTPTTTALLVAPITTLRARLLNTGVADTGSANTIVIAPSPAITAYAAYQQFTFKAAATNTGATTINVNSLGTKNVFNKGSALLGGEIVTGQIYTVIYDGTQFHLTNVSVGTPAWVEEGTLSWSAETTDKTLTLANSGRQIYKVVARFLTDFAFNMQFNGDSTGNYAYTKRNSTTLTAATAQTSMLIWGTGGHAYGSCELLITGGSALTGFNVGGVIARAHATDQLMGGHWNPGGSNTLSSLKFLVGGTSVTGTIHVYSLNI